MVTARYRRAVSLMWEHYARQLSMHPDAGAALDRFLEALQLRVLPMLLSQPNLGSPVSTTEEHDDVAMTDMLRIGRAAGRRKLQTRQWFEGEFALLYLELEGDVVLLSVRHQRQRSFP